MNVLVFQIIELQPMVNRIFGLIGKSLTTLKKKIMDYDVYHEKTMCGRTSMGVVRTTYLIDENGMIIYANDKVKADKDADNMLEVI